MIEVRLLAILDENFDDIEAPWKISRTDALEPLIGPTFDESLFFFGDGIEGSDLGVCVARFNLDKE